MAKFMTIEQVVDAARGDVLNHIASKTFKKEGENCGDDDENIYTIDSCYAQWAGADNEEAASNAISTMFEEEFAEYL
jgi:hypothetical protein